MNNIDYKETNQYWNQLEQEKIGRYSAGYIIPLRYENVALYRFLKELKFLNKFGKFGGNYLDLGCGTGNFLFEWRDKFDNLIGIDFSSSFVDIAKKQNKNFKNIKIYKANVLDFESCIDDKKFKFIFVGGCFMYLKDEDVSMLISKLFKRLENGGVLIFREPTTTQKRIYEKNIGARRTIFEYKELIPLKEDVSYYQNYSTNYTFFILLYLKIFPFLKNKVSIFNNFLIEFFFLYLPLNIYKILKRNMGLYHFFIINKNK